MFDRYPIAIGAALLATGGYAVTVADAALPVIAGSVLALVGIHAAVYGFLRTDFARLGGASFALLVPALPAGALVAGAWTPPIVVGPGIRTVASTAVYLAGSAFAVLVMRMLRISGGQHDTELVTAADLEDDPGS